MGTDAVLESREGFSEKVACKLYIKKAGAPSGHRCHRHFRRGPSVQLKEQSPHTAPPFPCLSTSYAVSLSKPPSGRHCSSWTAICRATQGPATQERALSFFTTVCESGPGILTLSWHLQSHHLSSLQ